VNPLGLILAMLLIAPSPAVILEPCTDHVRCGLNRPEDIVALPASTFLAVSQAGSEPLVLIDPESRQRLAPIPIFNSQGAGSHTAELPG